MANTAAFVNSCTKSAGNIVLVLGDALTSPTNTFTATFPLCAESAGSATGAAITTILRALNGS